MASTVNLDEFLLQTGGHGPCVGLHSQTLTPAARQAGVELRTVDGARTRTLEALFDAFAEAWHFPPWFGRNMNAFNDFMRDLDDMINTASGKPPALGYVTDIINAHLLLIDQPESFSWFATKMPRYRDYYRDEANPPAAFGLLLCSPTVQIQKIHERWLSVGVQVVEVTMSSDSSDRQ